MNLAIDWTKTKGKLMASFLPISFRYWVPCFTFLVALLQFELFMSNEIHKALRLVTVTYQPYAGETHPLLYCSLISWIQINFRQLLNFTLFVSKNRKKSKHYFTRRQRAQRCQAKATDSCGDYVTPQHRPAKAGFQTVSRADDKSQPFISQPSLELSTKNFKNFLELIPEKNHIPDNNALENLPSMTTPVSSSLPPPLLPPQVPLRIAVLEADHVLPQTRANYGGYTGLYTLLLHAGADLLGLPRDKLQLSKWDIVQRGPELSEQEVEKIEYPQLDDIDVILISGSSE